MGISPRLAVGSEREREIIDKNGRLLASDQEREGFTLIELMRVVGTVGVLAALALCGVRKYFLNAKTKARNGVGQMAKDAKGAFERESMASGVT